MTIEQLIAQLRAAMSARLEQRATHVTAVSEVRAALTAGTDPTAAQSEQMRAAQSAIATIDAEVEQTQARIAELEQELARDRAATALQRELVPAGGGTGGERRGYENQGRVTSEERTYTRQSSRSGVSFFGDAFRSQYLGDFAARQRLERHSVEVRVECEARAERGEQHSRATSTNSFAGLIVPQYLTDQAALIARAGRPIANSVGPSLELPAEGEQFLVPRGTTGASAAIQSAENTSVSSTDEVWSNLTVNVATVAGQQDVSRQSLERGTPGVDQLVYSDLAGAYMVALDQQVASGSGSSGQVLGIQNTAGINQSSPYTAALTPAAFYLKNAGAVSAIEENRLMAPSVIAMRPRRWMWMLGQVDSQNRPLAVADASGAMNAMATYMGQVDTPSSAPVGFFLGLPVITDANIPGSVGTGPEDLVFTYRAQDLLLWEEGDGMPQQLRFEQTLGNQLTVKLVVYGYFAFTAGRYPAAVSITGGNAGTAGFGQIAPAF